MLRDITELTQAPAPFWSSGQAKRFPTFTKNTPHQRFDAAIVGGGWVGLFAAYFLAKAGKKIVVLDQGLIGGAASGHSGGLILDKFEGDIRELIRLCGKKNHADVARILQSSHDAMRVIGDVARAERFDSGYRNIGHITAFRTEREAQKYIKAHEQVRALVPDLYPPTIDRLTPEETGSPDFFKSGAAYATKGGIFNPHLVVQGLLKALQKRGVVFYEESAVTGFEPASARGVRLMVGHASLEARHVILAGGDTSRLIEEVDAFPSLQPIMAAMLATEPLDEAQVHHIANRRGQEIPVICTGLGAPYYRFTAEGGLLFGSGGRAGWNEFPQIVKDISRDLFRVFPSLKKKVDPATCVTWGRMLYHDGNDLPFVYGLDPKRRLLTEWPDDVDALSMIGIAGLGGQGNNFGPYLGRAVAEALNGSEAAFDILRLFHSIAPKKPMTTRLAKSRLAAERRI